uniref:Uncharacterized protein n=1 Tax=Leersia perrieri TaxID=77586 RepID=A0A0D9VHI4_9ORYZ
MRRRRAAGAMARRRATETAMITSTARGGCVWRQQRLWPHGHDDSEVSPPLRCFVLTPRWRRKAKVWGGGGMRRSSPGSVECAGYGDGDGSPLRLPSSELGAAAAATPAPKARRHDAPARRHGGGSTFPPRRFSPNSPRRWCENKIM